MLRLGDDAMASTEPCMHFRQACVMVSDHFLTIDASAAAAASAEGHEGAN
jgi:hypothetical protein